MEQHNNGNKLTDGRVVVSEALVAGMAEWSHIMGEVDNVH